MSTLTVLLVVGVPLTVAVLYARFEDWIASRLPAPRRARGARTLREAPRPASCWELVAHGLKHGSAARWNQQTIDRHKR